MYTIGRFVYRFSKMCAVKILLFVLTLPLSLSNCLIVYDCKSLDTNITAISTKDIGACPDEKIDYVEKEVNTLVIQRNEFRTHKVFTCIVEVHKTIQHCGMHSHTSAVAGGISTYVHTLGAENCKKMHDTNMLLIHGKLIDKIKINSTTSLTLTLHGLITSDARCKGVSLSENGYTWEDVIVQAAIKITTRQYTAIVKLDDNEIKLQNGLICPFLAGYCIDSTNGETTWEVANDDSCGKGLTQLYKGKASLVTHKKQDNLKILVVEQDSNIFALSLQKTTTLCGNTIWQTEHPKILVLLNAFLEFSSMSKTILPQNTDLSIYINSKLLYTEQAYKRSVEKTYSNIVHRKCLLNREILRNRLLLAPLSPNALSAIIKNQLGHIGRVLGEVLYIMQCKPVIAEVRRSKYCYNELPIKVNNESKFMTPITHIIIDHAVQVNCEPLTPPLYFIDGHWIAFSPYPVLHQAPHELQVEKENLLTFTPIQPLGKAGLYSNKDIANMQNLLTFGLEHEAVPNIIHRRMENLPTDAQGYETTNIFNKMELQKLARSTAQLIWGWFTDIGLFFSSVIGFYVILKIIKYLINTVLNGLAIYKTFGCGITLIASVWNTLTLWLVHRKMANKQTDPIKEQQSDLNEVTVNPPLSTPPSITQPSSTYPTLPHWTEEK